LVLTDDPSTSLEVTIAYATEMERGTHSGAMPESWTHVNVGETAAKAMVLELSVPPKTKFAEHRYLIVLGDDAQLGEVGIDDGTQTLTLNRTTIESHAESADADVQTYEVETTLTETRKVALSGELVAPVDDTAGGTTFVRVTVPWIAKIRASLVRRDQ
jgi:hypothetical protein